MLDKSTGTRNAHDEESLQRLRAACGVVHRWGGANNVLDYETTFRSTIASRQKSERFGPLSHNLADGRISRMRP